ncbi:helix-turn-helix transcriptional regulator [Muricauda sp. NFXS6]|uniref:helix-turn-helix transcriptional regulator n=1 Tax=Flavobacteriaceae TaxID=49546 RepID=UPI0032DF8E53
MNKEIVSRIEAVIEHLDVSVSAFADEIGVQRSSISHLLNGRNKPSLDFVMKLVTAYPEVDLYWLLKGEGNFPKENTNQVGLNAPEVTEDIHKQAVEDFVSPLPPHKNHDEHEKKDPYKIVMFYEDGTFKIFNTKND